MPLFRRPGPAPSKAPEPRTPWPTGRAALDRPLGGGFPRAALTVVLGAGRPSGLAFAGLVAPAVTEALRQGVGVLAVPPSDVSADDLHRLWAHTADPTAVAARLRIPDYGAERADEVWRVPLARRIGRHALVTRMAAAETALGGPGGRPFLEIGATDRLAEVGGLEVARQQEAIGLVRSLAHGNTSVLWVPDERFIAPGVRDRAAVVLELEGTGDGSWVRGVRPAVERIRLDPPEGPVTGAGGRPGGAPLP